MLYRQITPEEIEHMADECRNVWELGTGPISDVLLVLENAGIVTVKVEVGTVKMDRLSNWSDADHRPYALIAKDEATCVRFRMDAAHELAHLVLHHGLEPKTLNNRVDFKAIEKQAFHFAGAFLMPAQSLAAEAWSPSRNAFLSLKARWKVSVGAMIARCANLRLIGEEFERLLWKHFSSRGWRKSEPLNETLPTEEPRLLNRSVRLLVEEKVRSRQELLSDFRLHAQAAESLCGLKLGYMTAEPADISSLPDLKRRKVRRHSIGSVIPFNRNDFDS